MKQVVTNLKGLHILTWIVSLRQAVQISAVISTAQIISSHLNRTGYCGHIRATFAEIGRVEL